MGFIATLFAGLCLAGAATAGVVITVQNQSAPVANIQHGRLPITSVPQYGQQ
jgi:hypothetical protein